MFKKFLAIMGCLMIFSMLNTSAVWAKNKVFEQTLYWQNYSFDIEAKNQKLTIKSHGLNDDKKDVHDIAGYSVKNIEVVDLNNDGYPELLIYLTNDGKSQYGQLLAYTTDRGTHLSLIAVEAIEDNLTLAENYRGHDVMMVEDNKLVRIYPIYLLSDKNDKPTGGVRKVTYKLVDTDNGSIFRIEKYADFNLDSVVVLDK